VAANLLSVAAGVACLRACEVIAYPTEAVYGLGCDPASEHAVREILSLKARPAAAGLILIADAYEHLQPYIREPSEEQLRPALASWPGPVTWLFPRAAGVPDWLAGEHETVAVRLTAHPVCRSLCADFGGAIVSTSANPSSAVPARSAEQVHAYFGDALCGTVEGELGGQAAPSEIRDLLSGRVIRPGWPRK
jgi:L-threonylcarbamoyladenylate synthase